MLYIFVTLNISCKHAFLQNVPQLNKELENLREFYDPETVDLMNWIKYANNLANTGFHLISLQ